MKVLLGGGVDKPLKGLRVHSLFLESKACLLRGNWALAQGNRSWITSCHIFETRSKLDCSLVFPNRELLTTKILS